MLMPLTLVFLVEFILRDVGLYPCTTCDWPPDWLPFILGIAVHLAFLVVVATFVWLNRRTIARLAIGGSWSDLVLCSSGWSSFTVLLNLAIADVPIVVRDSNSDFAIAAFVLEVALFVGIAALIAFRKAPFWTAIPLLIGVPDLLFVANAISSGWYVGLNPHRGSLCLFSLAYIHASHTAAVGLALQLIVIVFVALKTRANWILISVGCALAVMMATSLLIVGHGVAFDWMDVSCSSQAPGITSWMNYVWP
jgi:hypothetical protein